MGQNRLLNQPLAWTQTIGGQKKKKENKNHISPLSTALPKVEVRISVFQYFSISVFQCFSISVFQFFSISVFQYFSISVFQYFSISLQRDRNTFRDPRHVTLSQIQVAASCTCHAGRSSSSTNRLNFSRLVTQTPTKAPPGPDNRFRGRPSRWRLGRVAYLQAVPVHVTACMVKSRRGHLC